MEKQSTVAEFTKKPQHVALIMDGNGRWAQSRGMTRTQGHRKGADAVRRAVQAAGDFGIPYVTLFSFSSENWSRPEEEVGELMSLLRYYLKKETAEMHEKGVRLRVIGERDRLDDDIVQLIENAENLTSGNDKMTVVIALSYGGRNDIVHATRKLVAKAQSGDIVSEDITEDIFAEHVMTAGIPDPDLLIRTSGESRISNFLLWQLAYAEFYFTDTLWPDFDATEFEKALRFFEGRDRRYGGLKESEDQKGSAS